MRASSKARFFLFSKTLTKSNFEQVIRLNFVFRQPENVMKPRGQRVAHPTKVQQRRRVGLPAHRQAAGLVVGWAFLPTRNGRTQYNGRILFQAT